MKDPTAGPTIRDDEINSCAEAAAPGNQASAVTSAAGAGREGKVIRDDESMFTCLAAQVWP
jgi:hypothetical protein